MFLVCMILPGPGPRAAIFFFSSPSALLSSTEYPTPPSIMPADLLHPTSSHEKRVHKLKRLVQSPNR